MRSWDGGMVEGKEIGARNVHGDRMSPANGQGAEVSRIEGRKWDLKKINEI